MTSLTRPTQLGILGALALSMILTRGQHFASVDALPSASYAVFFLAGVLLRPLWAPLALFALASALDFHSLQNGRITDWCLSPAYWALLPAYGSLWAGGRWYARRHRNEARSLGLLAAAVAGSVLLAYLISGGCFYFFSGRYAEPTLAGFLPRIAQYYPRHLGNVTLYVGAAALLHAALRALRATPAVPAAR